MSPVATETIFEALFNDETFAHLPSLIAQSASARSAIIQWRHIDGSFETMSFSYHSTEFMDDYRTNYVHDDPWMRVCLRPPAFNTMIPSEKNTPFEVFDRSRVAVDLIDRNGDDTRHGAGAVLRSAWGDGIVSVMRGRGAGPFNESEVGAVQALLPALARVIQLRGERTHLHREAEVSRTALDNLNVAVLLVSRAGAIRSANRAAEDALRASVGIARQRGCLVCSKASDQHRLDAAIAAATTDNPAPTASALSIGRGLDLPSFLITVSPIIGASKKVAMLTFRVHEEDASGLRQRVQRLYGLSVAESFVAIDLAAGKTIGHIALDRGVQSNTVKAQIASVAAKIGCSRQAEIVAKIVDLDNIRGL